jgi:hypothetical protein
MGKQVDFIKIEDEVKDILTYSTRARNDDLFLYWVYCERHHSNIDYKLLLADSTYRKSLNLANYKSIERARRKVQEKNPDLISERTKRLREKEQLEYKEYARNN